jgi:hypothetical protein
MVESLRVKARVLFDGVALLGRLDRQARYPTR